MKRLLKDDGLLVFEIPGMAWRMMKDAGPVCRMIYGTRLHLKAGINLFYYSRRTLSRLLARHGFRPVAAFPEAMPNTGGLTARTLREILFSMLISALPVDERPHQRCSARIAGLPKTINTAADQTPALNECPACGFANDAKLPQVDVSNARGRTRWNRCAGCRSWFMADDYCAAGEAEHTQTMAWGKSVAGQALNDFKQSMFDAVLDRIERHAPAGASILDVGCSFGGFLFRARERGFRVRGVDIVDQAVQHVKAQGMDADVCSSLRRIRDVDNESIDVITVLDANMYWPDQPGELQGALRLLKPGGLLVMRVIDKSAFVTLGARLQRVLPSFSQRLLARAVNDHRFSMPLGQLLNVVRGNGFEVLSASPRGAVHSSRTQATVRLLFAIGAITWHAFSISIAPGALIVARKPNS